MMMIMMMTMMMILMMILMQVMPIVDLLAISNTHFQKLKDFIHMQLPSGFPVKIGKSRHWIKKSFKQLCFQKFLSSM